MNALTKLADRLCSHSKAPTLQPFTRDDWMAFSGCNTDKPEIAYTERGTVILDGCSVDVVLVDDPDGYSGDIYVRDFSTPEEARAIAEVLCANPTLAPAILGESVGHT